MSTGGVLGGIFNALLAPLIFPTVVEYPLTLVLVCFVGLSPGFVRSSRRQRVFDVILPLAVGVLTAGLVVARPVDANIGPAVAFGLPATLCLLFARRPIRFGLAVAAILAAGMLYAGPEGSFLYGERTFFGVHRVTLDPTGRYRLLLHGSTLHGTQSLDPARRLVPLAYFEETGPVGQLFGVAPGRPQVASVAVVGLGSGSIACHGTAGQRWMFYEIDPAVERVARDPRYFTFLRDCPPGISVVLGDARRSLGTAPDRHYDRIVLDAYSGDAPPVHLLTREAVALYLEKLTSNGLLAFHITNRHLDLAPPLAALARDAGLVYRLREDLHVSDVDRARGKIASRWLVMARHTADLGPLGTDPRWVAAPPPAPVVWTDDFSSLLPAFVWPGGRKQAT
jgi:spermidine synthase